MTSELKHNLPKLILNYTLWNSQFHLVVFTLFLLSKGLTMEQFFLAMAVGGAVAISAEVPSGAFADRVSRKWSLVIGTLIHIPLTYVMIVTDSFPILLAAFAAGGLSGAFLSGSDEALLYDSLKALKQEDSYKKITGQMRWYAAWAGALAGIIGGLLAKIDLSYPWWAWFAIAFPVLALQLSLVEPPHTEKGDKINDSYLLHLKDSFHQSLRGSASYFIFYAASIALFFSIGFWLWQPYLASIKVPVEYFGFLYAGINIISGLAAKQADSIENWLGMRTSLLAIPLFFAAGLFLQAQTILFWGLFFLLFQAIASGYFNPILNDYIHTRIPSSKRATILSIKNMTSSLLFIVLSPLIGRLIDATSLATALGLMAMALLLVGLLFGLFFRSDNVSS